MVSGNTGFIGVIMRVTKAQLLKEAENARQFARLPLAFVSRRNEVAARNTPGFVPSVCYGRGMHSMKDELGFVRDGFRLMTVRMPSYKPKAK